MVKGNHVLGPHRNQIVIMDAVGGGLGQVLEDTLRKRVAELGMNSDDVLLFLAPNHLSDRDDRSLAIAVYFGGQGRTDTFDGDVDRLTADGVPILPVVPQLRGYRAQVPRPLHLVNGFELSTANGMLDGVAALILERLHLLRHRRRLFISYKRTESQNAALQLYHDLDRSCFQVFLDTHAVRQGDIFQEQLFHRMADCDLLILLNTETIFDSDWVKREIEQADAMGISVLQLIWPGVERNRRTDAFFPQYLKESDFSGYGEPVHGGHSLTHAALVEIGSVVERLRVRALAAREKRLLQSFWKSALEKDLNPVLQQNRCVDLKYNEEDETVRIVLGVGIPDAVVFHDSEAMLHEPVPHTMRLLYDGRNISANWRKHLHWLNEMVKLKAVELQEVEKFLERVKGGLL